MIKIDTTGHTIEMVGENVVINGIRVDVRVLAHVLYLELKDGPAEQRIDVVDLLTPYIDAGTIVQNAKRVCVLLFRQSKDYFVNATSAAINVTLPRKNISGSVDFGQFVVNFK